MEKNQIYQAFGEDCEEMTVRLLEQADVARLLPGKGDRILIKPNLVVPCPAITGATTHPEVVRGIIRYLKGLGYNNIAMVEGCWIGEDSAECFLETGFQALSEETGVPILDVKSFPSHTVDCAGMPLRVTDAINDSAFLINVPVLKGHCQVKMTCAIKNIKGLVPDGEKRRFHALGIQEPLAHLACGVRQDLIVVDNICGDPSFEDGGDPFRRDCVMVSRDPVLVDALACRMLGLDERDVMYVKRAEELGAGSADLSRAEIVRINHGKYEDSYPGRRAPLDVSYAAEQLEACSACYANLIPALVRLRDEGLLERLNEKIAIGQGHRGKRGRLGIGNCTACFDVSVPGCPPDTEDIYRVLKENVE